MATAFSNPRLLSFSDHGAPYRGHWVTDASSLADGYAACHEVHSDQGCSLLGAG
jgi:hypothetical protein